MAVHAAVRGHGTAAVRNAPVSSPEEKLDKVCSAFFKLHVLSGRTWHDDAQEQERADAVSGPSRTHKESNSCGRLRPRTCAELPFWL